MSSQLLLIQKCSVMWSQKLKEIFNTKISQKSHQIIHSADSTILSKILTKHQMSVIFCISCHSTRSHEDFIKDDPKRMLLKMCQTCHHHVCCFSLICFAAADFFIELCDFFMTQSSCSDWFQCSTSCKMPASYSNLWYKACVRSDRGVQGGVPLICQISDIKLAFARTGGFREMSPCYAKSPI